MRKEKTRYPYCSFKAADAVLIAAIAAIACLIIFRNVSAPAADNPVLLITVDGEAYGRYSLYEDQVIEVGSGNVCEIKDGRAYMKSADCRDGVCLRSAAIGAEGGSIACIPNRVVLTVEDGAESEIDALVG